MKQRIFTICATLGKGQAYVGTDVASKDVVGLGKGYRGLVMENPKRQCWHVAVVGCGAIIGTDTTRDAVLAKVKADIRAGDRAQMRAQESTAMRLAKGAEVLENVEFFGRFKTFPERK
jgi:hypothetical protein